MPNANAPATPASPLNNAQLKTKEITMPILLWLLGVPLSLIIVLMLLGGI
jgi:hypothetical protein